jgi:stringent starvation protein B
VSDRPPAMTSNRPYLLRALYEWISDNQMSPHLLVDAAREGVQVPSSAIKDGRVVLNIAARAVAQLDIGSREIRFLARFGGVSQQVIVPVGAVLAIYPQETGQLIMLPDEDAEATVPPPDEPPEAPTDGPRKGAHLRIVK